MSKLLEWLKAHQFSCVFKESYGIECPGCGMQTAIILLLEGNLLESIHAYPALLPLLNAVLFLILSRIYKKNWMEKVLIVSLISTGILIVGNFLLKKILF